MRGDWNTPAVQLVLARQGNDALAAMDPDTSAEAWLRWLDAHTRLARMTLAQTASDAIIEKIASAWFAGWANAGGRRTMLADQDPETRRVSLAACERLLTLMREHLAPGMSAPAEVRTLADSLDRTRHLQALAT